MEDKKRWIWEWMNEDSLFEYQFEKDSLLYSAVSGGRMRDEVCISNFRKDKKAVGFICPEDIKGASYYIFESGLSKGQKAVYELRLKKESGAGYEWHRIDYMTLLHENGTKKSIIGRIVNIDRRKISHSRISSNLETDPETGLMGPEALRRRVDRFLLGEGSAKEHALFCIELPDYKEEREAVGCLEMDAVMKYISLQLKNMEGSAELLGRIGADRFVMVLKNTGRERAAARAAEMERFLWRCYIERDRGVEIGGWIGMACSPEDGISFEGLLEKAGQELLIRRLEKEKKASGEDGIGGAVQTGETGRPEPYDVGLISDALLKLTMLRDREAAVIRIFEETAEKLGLSRILVLKPEKDETIFIDRIWEKTSLLSGKAEGKRFSVGEDFDPYLYQYDIMTVYGAEKPDGPKEEFCRETGIQTAAFCFCIYEHDYLGTLVFIDSEKRREWSGFEKQTFQELSKLLWSTLFELPEAAEPEQSLIDALNWAEASNREKDTFISDMSHEIRTPMNAITGMTDLIKMHAGEKERVEEYTGKLEQASRYLLTVINDCLDISKIAAGNAGVELKSFRLTSLLERIGRKWFSKAREKGITVRRENFAGECILRSDPGRIAKILETVLDNAIKFTPEGGNIWVSVTRIYQKADRMILRFEVGDDGIGIDEAFCTRIFKPFAQERLERRDPFSGSGLGLTVCKSLVMLLHGTIRIKSKPGRGTEVVIELPLELGGEMVERVEESPEAPVEKVDFHGKRILLAEDNSLNAEIAKMVLEEEGFLVDCVGNGKKALDHFGRKAPYYYDVILMDIRMPIMDGWEAAKAIRGMEREDGGAVPIVAMTANAFNEDVIKSFASGMNDHITKPIERERLLDVLNRLLAKRSGIMEKQEGGNRSEPSIF